MPELINTAQAARRLGVTRDWVHKLIVRGKLTARKIGRDWLVDTHSVAAYQMTRRPPGRPAGAKNKPKGDRIDE